MKKIKLLILLILSTVSFFSFGQQDAQFSHYMFNGVFYNPGYVGIEKLMRVNFISRVQWLTYDPTDANIGGGAPQSNILSVSSPIKDYKIGAGAYLLYESLGPIRNVNFNLSASKHFDINNGILGLGLSGGLVSTRLSTEDYRVVNLDDPIYKYLTENNGVSQLRPDLNVGAWYEHQKYYAGISFFHVPKSRFTYGANGLIGSELANHMYFTAGYRWTPAYTLLITPSFIIQTDLHQITYVFGGLVEYNKKVWAGLQARQSVANRDESRGGKGVSNDDIILMLGINLLKNKHNQDALRIGYAFDFVTSGADAKERTSHEIMVSYFIPSIFGPGKPPVRTPRYRHEN